jgi:DNA-binding IclR family transcriptional regulator
MKNDRVSYTEIMKDIGWIRHVGYCYFPNWPTPDVSSISIALDADLHGIPLAIGVGGLADRISRKKADILAIMREMIAEFNERQQVVPVATADDLPGAAPDAADDQAVNTPRDPHM